MLYVIPLLATALSVVADGPEDTVYAYHATEKKLLKTISREGLVPFEPMSRSGLTKAERKQIKEQESGIYFCPTEDLAKVWGITILRFPWPQEFDEDPYSDGKLIDGEVVRTSYFTFEEVLPEVIECRVGSEWKSIRSMFG